LTLLHALFFETNANDVSDSMAYTSADLESSIHM